MSVSTIEIERVVREVLAELSVARLEDGERNTVDSLVGGQWPVARKSEIKNLKSEISNSPSPVSRPSSPLPNPSSPVPNHQSLIPNPPSPLELVLNSRVVTMEEVAGRLNAARRVVVFRNAIVTPAVRDELIRRGIALAYAESPNGRAATSIRLAMITTGTDFDPTALVAGLAREGLSIEHTASDCIIASTEQLAAEVTRPDTLGVLLTRHTAPGLCLANRHGGVRAVAGVDAAAVAAAAASVGANMLVADPKAGTFFQLKQMVTEFCRGGVRACPSVFRAPLA